VYGRFKIEDYEWEKLPTDAPQSLKLLAQQCTSYEFSDRPESLEVQEWLLDLYESVNEDACPVPVMEPVPAVPDEVGDALESPEGSNTNVEKSLGNVLVVSPTLIRTKKQPFAGRGRRDANLYKGLDTAQQALEPTSETVPQVKLIQNGTKGRRGALMNETEQMKSDEPLLSKINGPADVKNDLNNGIISGQSTFPQKISSGGSSITGIDKLFPGSETSEGSTSMLYKIFAGSQDGNYPLSQLEITRLAARNSSALTPEMIKYLHLRSSDNNDVLESRGELVPVRMGYLSKRNTYGFRNWKKFLFVVTKNSLSYRVSDSSGSEGSGVNSYGGLRFIQLRGASIELTRDCRFRILNASDTSDLSAIYNRELAAESVNSMKEWIDDIQAAIDEANKGADNLATGLFGVSNCSRGSSATTFCSSSHSASVIGTASGVDVDEVAVSHHLLNSGQSDVYSLGARRTNTISSRPIDKLAESTVRHSVSLISGCFNSVSGSLSTHSSINEYSSLDEWLAGLGLPEYSQTFSQNGYKYDMVVAMGLREADLDFLEIMNPLHRAVIQSGTKLFLEYAHVAISGARQFDSVTVFVVVGKYKFCRSSLCLRYTDFKRFDT
jgi:hypothetical protein